MLRSHRSHFSRKRSRKAWFLRAIHCGAGRSARPVACAKIFNQYLLKAALLTPSLSTTGRDTKATINISSYFRR